MPQNIVAPRPGALVARALRKPRGVGLALCNPLQQCPLLLRTAKHMLRFGATRTMLVLEIRVPMATALRLVSPSSIGVSRRVTIARFLRAMTLIMLLLTGVMTCAHVRPIPVALTRTRVSPTRVLRDNRPVCRMLQVDLVDLKLRWETEVLLRKL